MENKINIAKILSNCPRGMELDCSIYNKVTLINVDDREDIVYPIRVFREDGNTIALTKYGQYTDADFAKCVIFPKGKTTWEGFHRPFVDGDVVVAEDAESFYLFLLKHLTHSEDDNNYDGYCYFGWDFQCNELFPKGNWVFNRLANEEEKAKLFDAIKANGFKWNEETKTLEKWVKPKFKVGDRIKANSNSNQSCQYLIIGITDTHYTLEEVEDKFKYTEPIDKDKNWELVANKFDINTLKPFDKVLVRNTYTDSWHGQFYQDYDENEEEYPFECTYNSWKYCIPYEGNEHLRGTTDDCDKYYKNWK